jgi:geranylgeranyl diphosphate synthase type II
MKAKIERLERILTDFYKNEDVPQRLSEAVLYSLMAGGKRIRPVLLLEMLEAFGLSLLPAHFQLAAALEMVHTGSLIHDDLPAMDNDDYRRGKLTNHRQFDEATAVLAGDSLFLDPYYLLARCDLPAEMIVRLVKELSFASGSFGMVAGQMLDMDGEGRTLDLLQIEQIHQLKTGRMLTFPFIAAGIIAQQTDEKIGKLRQIGRNFGLAFQIRDDILDVTANFDEIGKTPGKDLLEEKSTYVSLLGLDKAKQQLTEKLSEAKRQLTSLSLTDSRRILEMIESLEIK